MFAKIKDFIKRFIPLPARLHQKQNKDFLLKLNSLERVLKQELRSIRGELKLEKATLNEIVFGLNQFESNMLRVQPQPFLQHFELHIVDHCNLNCKGCNSFSPIAQEYCVPLDNIKNDLNRMSFLTDGKVPSILILGGEPLLHPNLPEILTLTRAAFKRATIQIVTNGILLLQQTQEFWDTCKNDAISISLNKYPINLNFDSMMQRADENEVNMIFRGRTGESEKKLSKFPLDLTGLQDAKTNFWNCYAVNKCTKIKNGKLHVCPATATINHFNHKFGINLDLEPDDSIDIHKVSDISEILSFLSTPNPFCRYCKILDKTKGHKWERSTQNINEWV